ncbi:restriction endonuclease subunit S [Ligilactobacillus salivarius]|uniref:restriction endonuclease subunit S n=1 Tax=Ligilactobacillus salivarius TaxID=1624 RepID=UPI0025A49A61|nr:restriction endonuclease subunit S [Ligilactobacillus salivarius]MDM8223729.1 restriction endonuclease subunit S [Ligilactobacillus salivarius]
MKYYLKDIAKIKNGKKTILEDVGVKVYGSNGVIGFSKDSNAPRNSIIIGRVGANTGSVFFSDEEHWVTDNAISVVPNNKINPIYLFYLLKQKKLNRLAEGSAQPLVNQKILNSFLIDIPSLEIQNKIADKLYKIDKKIEINNKINTNLKLLKTAIFNDMFNSKLLNNLNGKLADIAKIQTGKRPISRSSTYNNENKYPIVGASKIMGYTNSYNIDDSIITTGRVGTHGIIQRFREPVWISDNSFIFTSHYEDYLYEILKNRINYTSLNRGSTQPLITQTDLKNIDIYVPTDEEHRQFKTLIYPITNIEFILNNEQHKLFKIKNLLLNKFFNSSKLTN